MAYGILYDYLMGQSQEAYRYFGAHFGSYTDEAGKLHSGVTFRLYAPCADNVSVIGSWNGWNPEVNPLNKVDASGVWEGFVEGLHNYDSYKFHFRNARGEYVDHADPFAFYSELRPGTCSRLFDIENFAWHDADFLAKRTRSFDEAMSIYEIHLGSWRGLKDGRFPSYEEVADDLIPYLKEIRVNFVDKRIHVRLLTKDRKDWIHELYKIMIAIHSLAKHAKA